MNVVIAALFFYLIPVLIGSLLRSRNRGSKAQDRLEIGIEQITLDFIFGSVAIFLLAIILNRIDQREFLPNFRTGIYVITGISLIHALYRIVKHHTHKQDTKIKPSYLVVVSVLVLLNVVVYSIWRYKSPIYTTLNWDLYHQQNIVNDINSGVFNYSPNNLSDSFGFTSYTTLFHTLAAIPIGFIKVEATDFWYYIEFFHLLSTSLIAYFVLKAFTRNRGIAFIGAVLSSLFFESLGAYTTLFWIPQNIAATVGAFIIA